MLIHFIQKLATKLPEVSTPPPQRIKPYGKFARPPLHIDRHQCVLFCHDTTRYMHFIKLGIPRSCRYHPEIRCS